MRAVDVDRFCERLPTDGADAEASLPLALLTDRYRMAVPLIERLIGTFQRLSVHPSTRPDQSRRCRLAPFDSDSAR
jgi:hypothetical protein